MNPIDLNFLGDQLNKSIETKWSGKALDALQKLKERSCAGPEWTGWYDWPAQSGFALEREISDYLDQLDVDYDAVLVVGIGGSYLGTRAVADALSHEYVYSGLGSHKPIFYAGHHLSSESLSDLMDVIEKFKPVINVVSKTGVTTEPSLGFRFIRDRLSRRFGADELKKRIVCTTSSASGVLRQLCVDQGWRAFSVPDDVGGRYSVLTAVGLLPLALAGFDTEAMLQGADQLFRSLEGADATHPVLSYGAARQALYQEGHKKIELLSFTKPKLSMFVEWWKQLFGESEGKAGLGIMPAGLQYTTDLHSLGQLAQDGERNVFATHLHFSATAGDLKIPRSDIVDTMEYLDGQSLEAVNRKAQQATKVAHFDGGVPCMELTFGQLNESTMGQMFAFFETACAISGALQGVNPFDQPGVEAYKKNLFGLLGKKGFESIGESLRGRIGD